MIVELSDMVIQGEPTPRITESHEVFENLLTYTFKLFLIPKTSQIVE